MCANAESAFLLLYEHDFSLDQMTALFTFNSQFHSTYSNNEVITIVPISRRELNQLHDASFGPIFSDASNTKSVISKNDPFLKKYNSWNQSKPFGSSFSWHYCECYCKLSQKVVM